MSVLLTCRSKLLLDALGGHSRRSPERPPRFAVGALIRSRDSADIARARISSPGGSPPRAVIVSVTALGSSAGGVNATRAILAYLHSGDTHRGDHLQPV